jgi:hypothetical protein
MYGYYVGKAPSYETTPSEAEYLVAANKQAIDTVRTNGPVGKGVGNLWYVLLASYIVHEGQTKLEFSNWTIGRDLAQVRHEFRVMTEGRDDGGPVFAFVALYTIDGHKIVDSQWWADARYVVTMSYSPATAADRAARALLA